MWLISYYPISFSKAVNKRAHMHREVGYEKNLDWITQASGGARVEEAGERGEGGLAAFQGNLSTPACPSLSLTARSHHGLVPLGSQVPVRPCSQQWSHSPCDSSAGVKVFLWRHLIFQQTLSDSLKSPAHCTYGKNPGKASLAGSSKELFYVPITIFALVIRLKWATEV